MIAGKKKRFVPTIMDYPFKGLISEGMWKKVKNRIQDFNSQSDYLRYLIMNDLKIDEYGNARTN